MRRTLPVMLTLLALAGCGMLGGQGAGKTNPIEAVFKDPLTTAEIKAILLTVKDLPPGYTVDADDDETEDDGDDGVVGATPECTRLWKAIELDGDSKDGAVGKADIDFEADEMGPFLSESVSSYKGSKVKNAMAVVQVALEKCRKFTSKENDGSTMTFEVAPAPFPKLGDQTVSGKLSAKEPTFGITFGLNFVMVRVDQNLVTLASFGFGDGGMTTAQFEKAVRKAVERVQAAS